MGSLIKRGPKKKRRKLRSVNHEYEPQEREMTDDDFKRMMEDAPVYIRHNGAIKQVR